MLNRSINRQQRSQPRMLDRRVCVLISNRRRDWPLNAASIKVVGILSNSRRHHHASTAVSHRLPPAWPPLPPRPTPSLPATTAAAARNKWINSDRLDLATTAKQFTQLIHAMSHFLITRIRASFTVVLRRLKPYTIPVHMSSDLSARRNHIN